MSQVASDLVIAPGRVAVITGAASGIGRALAERALHERMRVVLADVEAVPLQRTADELRSSGGDVLAVTCDVGDAEAVDRLAERSFSTFGAVHLLCNNAGVVARFAPLWEQADSEWQWAFGVNVMGIAHGIRSFVPRMMRQAEPSHVVNTASEAAFATRPFVGVYHASKHAVLAVSETLALDLQVAGANVRVSTVFPGGVNTQVMDAGRNRPADANAVTDASSGGAVLETMYRKSLARATAPDAVAAAVFDGVSRGDFYIFSHPEIRDLQLARAQAIHAGVYPAVDAALAARLKG